MRWRSIAVLAVAVLVMALAVSGSRSQVVNLSVENDWTQEDATLGTDFVGGAVQLHNVGTGGDVQWMTNADLSGTSVDIYAPNYLENNFTANETRWLSGFRTYPIGADSVHRFQLLSEGDEVLASTANFTWYGTYGFWAGLGYHGLAFDEPYLVQAGVTYKVRAIVLSGGFTLDRTAQNKLPYILYYRSLLYNDTAPYYVTTANKSMVNTSLWRCVKNVTVNQSTPENTSMRYLVSFDRRNTWKRYNGSSWEIATLGDLQTIGMDKSTLESINLSQWCSAGGFASGTLDFAVDLRTTYTFRSPKLNNISVVYTQPPYVANYSSALTTNFSSMMEFDNVMGLSLANPNGRIDFPDSHGVDAEAENYDSNVRLGDRFISVNMAGLDSSFNSSANVTMNNVDCADSTLYYGSGTYTSGDQIRSLGQVCPVSVCSDISCVGGMLSFTAAHFSGYAVGANSELLIFDELEAGGSRFIDEAVLFYANYTNISSSAHIAGATCSVSFDDGTGPFSMTDSGSQYNYNKTAGFATDGIHSWNVTCAKSGFNTLNATDDILIGGPDVPEFSGMGVLAALGALALGAVLLHRRG